jgi:AcrR family transcriptional regulator
MVTKEGAWNFTLREVARRAGVSHAAPYNHFEDKLALLAEVAALGFQALRRRMETAARRQPRSSLQALTDIATSYIRFGIEHPAHYRLMFGPDPPSRRPQRPARRHGSTDRWRTGPDGPMGFGRFHRIRGEGVAVGFHRGAQWDRRRQRNG